MEEPLILDRYRPLTELGAGGHGSVVLAFDTKMARRVAIKRLPLPSGRATTRVGLAEARTAAMLNHPHIVAVHEYEIDDEYAYLVMEHVDGLSLADLLDETGTPLDDDEAAAIVRSVGDALAFAHHNGVLHLDVKPGNVLIDRGGRVKIADFGIAALTGSLGNARGAGGTIGYMPPEQIRGEALDDATDQWAFAVLVYELLTLANPFDADTPEGSLFKIEVADLPAPSEFVRDLPKGLDSVLVGALAADPTERYPSVADLANRLLDLLGDPLAGEEALAGEIAYFVTDEEEAADEAFARLGLWDRLAPRSGVFARAGAAVFSAWLAWTGLAPFALGPLPDAGATALAALAGALAPGLGLALGIIALTVGLVARAGIGWAALFALPAVAYWVWRGRKGTADALVPLAAPLLGVARAAGVAPLLAGFVYEPVPALAVSALAAFAVMAVSAGTGAPAPFLDVDWRFFIDPWSAEVLASNVRSVLAVGPLVAALGWGVAGAAMSLFCRHGSRMAAALGALVAVAIMRVAYMPWRVLAEGPSLTQLLTHGGIALMIVAVVIALGPPTRGE